MGAYALVSLDDWPSFEACADEPLHGGWPHLPIRQELNFTEVIRLLNTLMTMYARTSLVLLSCSDHLLDYAVRVWRDDKADDDSVKAQREANYVEALGMLQYDDGGGGGRGRGRGVGEGGGGGRRGWAQENEKDGHASGEMSGVTPSIKGPTARRASRRQSERQSDVPREVLMTSSGSGSGHIAEPAGGDDRV